MTRSSSGMRVVRTVFFLRTVHVAESNPPCTVRHIQQDGTYANVNSPLCLPDYQKDMGGVDYVDQLASYYNVGEGPKNGGKKCSLMELNVAYPMLMC